MTQARLATNMTPSELKSARETYSYVPARLIRTSDHVAADLSWKSMKLIMYVPKAWDAMHIQIPSQYSSCELDNFHGELLQSEKDEDLVQGLLSVVFWGFSSGVDGRLNVPPGFISSSGHCVLEKKRAAAARNSSHRSYKAQS